MKASLFALTCCLLAVSAAAQPRFPAVPRTDSVRLRIVEKNGRLALQWLNTANRFPGFAHGELRLENVALDDADLVVWYRPGKTLSDQRTDFSVQFRRLRDGVVFRPDAADWIELPASEKTDRGVRRRAFADAAETVLQLGETYSLAITSVLLLDVECTAARPALDARRLWPHYGLGVVGVAAVALGQVQNQRTKTYTRLYEQRWGEGAASATAQPDFDVAADAARQARVYTYAGVALLAADAVWLFAKWRKIRRQQSTYDRYCVPADKVFGAAAPRWQPECRIAPAGLLLTLNF